MIIVNLLLLLALNDKLKNQLFSVVYNEKMYDLAMAIEFNIPATSNKTLPYITEALNGSKLSGEGVFNKKINSWFKNHFKCSESIFTPSCTAALEMAMVLADIQPGDEIIMPSFTFSSTANAVALFGGVPVFVDVDSKTMNIDIAKIEPAINSKTKAIMPVHYAGTSCDMDNLMAIAKKYSLFVIEDAAQAIGATYKSKPLGTQGHMAAFSFHDTKNITCGEGGALIINDSSLVKRSYVIRDKGTNRQQFLNGEIDKYTWIDKGSSYLVAETVAAHLLAQLEDYNEINKKRLDVWSLYHNGLKKLEDKGLIKRMNIPEFNQHNAHIYFFFTKDESTRNQLFTYLKNNEIKTASHYIPLHSAPAGLKYGKQFGSLNVTNDLSYRLLRLPMHMHLDATQAEKVISAVNNFFR